MTQASEQGGVGTAAADRQPMLQVENLVKHFPIRSGVFVKRTIGQVRAVDGVSLDVHRGQTVALVGESGCGKSTTARAILRLLEPTSGRVRLDGVDVTGLNKPDLRRARRDMQIVFQDPYASLNPRMTIRQILSEKYRLLGQEVNRATISDLLDTVGLAEEYADRYPHEFSGGQRQRIAIARALVLKPRLVVLDEPTSALDVSVQAQVVDLLRGLQAKHRLAYLFISHDLRVVRAMAHRIAVLKDGVVVEEGEAEALTADPREPYTRALMAAAFDLKAEPAVVPP